MFSENQTEIDKELASQDKEQDNTDDYLGRGLVQLKFICVAPLPMNTRKNEIRIIIKGLNFASQETMMAVKPRPPAVLVEIV